jgi:hypothetical protein
MKHNKKGKKYVCLICFKTFFPSHKLKLHYAKDHSDEELMTAGIELEALKAKRKSNKNL